MVTVYRITGESCEIKQVRPKPALQAFAHRREVKQVMPKYNDHPDSKDHRKRQVNQQTKQYHADTDGPDHLENDKVVKGVKGYAKRNDHTFDQDQHKASFDQEAAELGFCLFPAHQPGRRAGQENKDRRTEMGDPAGKKQAGCCEIKICRTGIDSTGAPGKHHFMKEIADMIQGHNDHDNTPEYIDRVDPGAGNSWFVQIHKRRLKANITQKTILPNTRLWGVAIKIPGFIVKYKKFLFLPQIMQT
jgi:hypothetical protein